ncbi:MAG: F0F1 ATP synthase subunit B [Acidimicrobiales bacterium]
MRRSQLLLGAAAIAVLAAVSVAPHASAQEEGGESEAVHEVEELVVENGGTEFDAHCVELLAEGQSVDACQEAPNVLLPETNELIWGAFGFLVVLFFVTKFGYPAIKKSMDARTERIRSDLDAAENQRSQADELLADYRAQLADAKNESAGIIEEARQAADALRRDQEGRLTSELAELRAKATADIDAAKVQAIADLRGEVAQLAVGAAEVVIGKNLDEATQVQLIEDYINQVANRS